MHLPYILYTSYLIFHPLIFDGYLLYSLLNIFLVFSVKYKSNESYSI